MYKNKNDSEIKKEKDIKNFREDINALFSMIKFKKWNSLFLIHFDDTNTTTGTNESEYWGIRGIKNAYKALVDGGVDREKFIYLFLLKVHIQHIKRKRKENNQSN